ncbi:hypothetical protein RN001_014939 [Aquatica leii]|uniref:G patch domain-containing protein n=1 Tax=Aquatica leii TaxID=1421715 RepID=A0AAN7SNB8_9COLE|nr:hypothetical protein RN001_014939 [Aquatica leii]
MSDSEEEVRYFGKPLDPYDEDAFPKKRPISVEDQVAKDAQGRRRFHGAFTGGFSAGFYNSVGSLEGWTPSEFKSSRSDKAQNRAQNPIDFMDDEDMGEFGIAPHVVKATDEYSQNKKRKKQVFVDGPIPGEPVLDTLLQAGNETVGYFLMKNMNRKQRKAQAGPKVYGCVMPTDLEDDTKQVEYTVHDIYKQYLSQPKANTYGLSYVGLDKTHTNLFQPTRLTVRERNNKKLSIAGQAFGVGAFEDDDEDIYVKDDMSKYDFELSAETSKNKAENKQKLVFDLFVKATSQLMLQEKFPPPMIPTSFSGKHNVKKSRFEPVPDEKLPERKEMNVSVRAKYLGEDSEKAYTPSKDQLVKTEKSGHKEKVVENTLVSSLLVDRFVTATQDDDVTNILETVKPSEEAHGTSEMHAAVKLKMFGPLTRVTLTWTPNSLLCKRFNVPEPKFEQTKEKKRTKNLIFEYQKHAEQQPDHTPGLSVQKVDVAMENQDMVVVKEAEVEGSSTVNLDKPPIEKPFEVTRALDPTERVDVSKNTDLFKAIFLSSDSESDDEEVTKKEEEENARRQEVLTATVVTEPLVPKIKPMREGILSNISFRRPVPKPVELQEEKQKQDDDTYGPKLPSAPLSTTPAVLGDVDNDDEWVEKDEKHKKHKKKHKKQKKKKSKK